MTEPYRFVVVPLKEDQLLWIPSSCTHIRDPRSQDSSIEGFIRRDEPLLEEVTGGLVESL